MYNPSPTRNTYHGHTAGGLLRTAKIDSYGTGIHMRYVTVYLAGGESAICHLLESQAWGEPPEMVLQNVYGEIARLTLSPRAEGKLRSMIQDADNQMLAS